MTESNLVDVIIPTFNRANLLTTTIPTYLQEGVKNIYLVDDCSTDNTEAVSRQLSLQYSKIKYLKLKVKGKQMGAKNLGLKHSTAPYIYFGDDDSILKPLSIKEMILMATSFPKHIIGARHIYMTEYDNLNEIVECSNDSVDFETVIFDPLTMRLNLQHYIPESMNLPFCQACFLIQADIAQSIQFDEKYLGTCFREETDYIINARKLGLGLRICNSALQVNLPRSYSVKGGTSSVSSIVRHISEIFNEYRFFRKHGDYIGQYVNFDTSPSKRVLKLCYYKLMNVVSKLTLKLN